MNMQAKSAT